MEPRHGGCSSWYGIFHLVSRLEFPWCLSANMFVCVDRFKVVCEYTWANEKMNESCSQKGRGKTFFLMRSRKLKSRNPIPTTKFLLPSSNPEIWYGTMLNSNRTTETHKSQEESTSLTGRRTRQTTTSSRRLQHNIMETSRRRWEEES